VFTGRVLGLGEPVFLPSDTAKAVALALEEADTCPTCGYPKSWCRGKGSQFTDYEVAQETCQATYRLALFRESDDWKNKHDATKQAVQLSARFRPGHEPPIDAGLDTD